ncbi:MAG: biotin/lipoyl-binding protein [Oscillospiraceae bacterium]|nr:biotin/lipoyl-binding protein [Oscillospiraceae bacterium]
MKYVVTLNGKNYEVDVNELSEAIVTNISDAAAPAVPAPASAPVAAPAAAAPAAPAPVVAGSGTQIKAPMPGAILKVNASQGQKVNEGDVLFILEAMKMENEIVASVSGTVSQVLVTKGQTVDTDAVLAVIG